VLKEKAMPNPVAPSQFQVGKDKIVHKPTKATFNFVRGETVFKSIDWGEVEKQASTTQAYRKDDVMRVAQTLLAKLPR
jgi:hypothetical protein